MTNKTKTTKIKTNSNMITKTNSNMTTKTTSNNSNTINKTIISKKNKKFKRLKSLSTMIQSKESSSHSTQQP